MLAAVTEFTRQAEHLLRHGRTFEWSTIPLLAITVYVYAVEVERRRWDIVLAGLSLWLFDWFNELVNSAVLHISGRAALWTVTGRTSYLILIGLTIEISFFFLIAGVVFVKMLPADRHARVLGIPNRALMVTVMSLISVGVEILLHSTGYFHWHYWWWNVATFPVIAVFGYATFFATAARVYDMGTDHRRQLRVVGFLLTVDLVLGIAFALAGWL